MPPVVPRLELTIPFTSIEKTPSLPCPVTGKVCSVLDPEQPQKLMALWTLLHRRNVQTLAAARKKSEKGHSSGVSVLIYGDSIMEAFTGLRWGLPLTQLAFMHDLNKRYFSHMPTKFCAISDDGPKELQWRIQHGEGPFGLQAKLAVVHIGSRDIGKCGTPVHQDNVQDAMRTLAGQIMGCVELLLRADKTMHVALIGILPQRNMAIWGPVVHGINDMLESSCNGLARTSFHDLTASFVFNGTGLVSSAKLNCFLYMDGLCLHPNMAGMDIIGESIGKIMKQYFQECIGHQLKRDATI